VVARTGMWLVQTGLIVALVDALEGFPVNRKAQTLGGVSSRRYLHYALARDPGERPHS
jgi:hypothetical protein